MKRWLTILFLSIAAAAAQASAGNGSVSPAHAGIGKPNVVILSAGTGCTEQVGLPLAAAIASSGSSQLAGAENAPGKVKVRHTGGCASLFTSEHADPGSYRQQHKYSADRFGPVAFTRPADYYIYGLRRIII